VVWGGGTRFVQTVTFHISNKKIEGQFHWKHSLIKHPASKRAAGSRNLPGRDVISAIYSAR